MLTNHPGYDPLLNLKEAASYLGTSAVTLYRMASKREIAVVRNEKKSGSTMRFRLSALNSWAKAHESRPSKN